MGHFARSALSRLSPLFWMASAVLMAVDHGSEPD